MKNENLLETHANPNHKRAKLFTLTDKGNEMFAMLEKKQIPWANSLANELKLEDLELTSTVLQKIINQFNT